MSIALATTLTSAWAATGAEVLQQLNHDGNQALDIPEMIDSSARVFSALGEEGPVLMRNETAGRMTEADWKAVNLDGDDTIGRDEWLTVARQRFLAADGDKDRKLTLPELDSPSGQLLVRMIIN